ncbi:MAG TPA: extradiol ring-cleavage dioxygenase [Casimicrobiaceae bacterium]|nr:extradiol ring-cleavage dioxygenase [Casimicrobiaceae bacterium]
MTGVVAAALVAHVPTLGRSENTPEYQQTLVQAERTMGAAVREALKPDAWVIVSTHWISTFDWFATCQAKHEGLCVAQEAPNLIPGLPYSYRGDPELGAALVDAWKDAGCAAVRNEASNYHWDYGTFVPLQYIDPSAEVPVVGLPVVLMADHGECLRAGAAIHAVAKRLNRRVVFLCSSALSHQLVRGRHNWPTPERVEADKRFVDFFKRGAIDETIAGFTEYSKKTVAEMGGRALATMVGVAAAMSREGKPMAARQYGDYAQSSGSNNAVMLIADRDTLARVEQRTVEKPEKAPAASEAKLAALEETE